MKQNRNKLISSVKMILECWQYVDTTVHLFHAMLFGYHELCTPQEHLVEEADSSNCGIKLLCVVTEEAVL